MVGLGNVDNTSDTDKPVSTAQQTAPPAQLNANNGTIIADEIYLHFQFHPNDISHRQIRDIYDEHLAKKFHSTLGIKQAIVAYSRPKNIGDYITQAKLHQAAGKTASIIMGLECPKVQAETPATKSKYCFPLTSVI